MEREKKTTENGSRRETNVNEATMQKQKCV